MSARHRSYSFGEFVLDLDRGALLKLGADIPLRAKSFEMLSYLVERHGLLVTRDELLETVWAEVIVTEESLTQCLFEIRKALGDVSREMVRTVPRRGFIFDVPVTAHVPGENTALPFNPSFTAIKRQVSTWWVGAAVVLVLAILAAWWSTGRQGIEKPLPQVEPAAALPTSIVILPFEDMSTEGDQTYFADGMAEELINLLSKVPNLRVLSRSTAFSFRDQPIHIPTIAQQLHVTHILEGSVRKAGNRVRITTQLIEAHSDSHLWSKTWDRTLDDIFAIQDEIAAQVVAQLEITLSETPPQTHKTNLEAYALLLKARHLIGLNTEKGLLQAKPLLDRSLELDPLYLPTLNTMSWVYYRQSRRGLLSRVEGDRLLQETVDRVLAIDPEDGPANVHRAWSHMENNRDLVAASQLFTRAIASDPWNEDVLRGATFFAVTIGRPDQAITLGEYAVAHNPLCGGCYWSLSSAYRYAGRFADAVESYKSALHWGLPVEPELAMALFLNGETKAALALFEQLDDDDSRKLQGKSLSLYELGLKADYELMFTELRERWGADRPREIAQVYAWTGDIDKAFSWLDKAIEKSTWDVIRSYLHPLYRNLYPDQRWQTLLERIGRAPKHLDGIEFELNLPD